MIADRAILSAMGPTKWLTPSNHSEGVDCHTHDSVYKHNVHLLEQMVALCSGSFSWPKLLLLMISVTTACALATEKSYLDSGICHRACMENWGYSRSLHGCYVGRVTGSLSGSAAVAAIASSTRDPGLTATSEEHSRAT